MEVLDGTRIRDRAVVLDDVLLISDLHIGRGSASSLDLPVGDGVDMIHHFESLCEATTPEEVVIAGDVLHSFETIPRRVRKTVSGFHQIADEYDAELTVTPGNHDTLLDSVWDGTTTPEYLLERCNTVICHGHREPETAAERYIIGHDHPTISIEGQRRPCVLAADDAYRGAGVLMLPAFNRLVPGVEINEMRSSDFLSPLVEDADRFAPIVRDTHTDETLHFPPLGEFRHRL